MGNRFENLSKAVTQISLFPYVKDGSVRQSKIYESQAWGFDSMNDFYNIGVCFDTGKEENIDYIFEDLQKIERALNKHLPHRDKEGNYIDRYIDIDLIAVDEKIYKNTNLEIPHIKMHLRSFVLMPMMELNEDWVHPVFHKNCKMLLAELNNFQFF